MAKKKEKIDKEEIIDKEKMVEKPKIERKNVNKKKDIQPQLFSQKELADMFGISVYQMDSLYSIRGMDRKKKLGFEEAQKLFEM